MIEMKCEAITVESRFSKQNQVLRYKNFSSHKASIQGTRGLAKVQKYKLSSTHLSFHHLENVLLKVQNFC